MLVHLIILRDLGVKSLSDEIVQSAV